MSSSLELSFGWCGPGDTVAGHAAAASAARLVRRERSPCATHAHTVAEAVADVDGAFALRVPAGALPTAHGVRCDLRYVVSAAAATGGPEVVVIARATPHVELSSRRADRLLACWSARHFHLELGDAELEGGGCLAGRLHRHRAWPPGAIAVHARCLECWRLPFLRELGHAQWCSATLWVAVQMLEPDPRATWAPFAFPLPAHLPPAVEAPSIAWRYELFARRHVRHWLDETAALTPLLHELV